MSLSILHVGPQGLDSAVAPDGFLIAQRRLERAVHRAAQAEGVTLRFDAMGSPGLDENTPAEKRALVWGGVQRLVIEDMAPEIARNQARRTGTDLRADALNTAAGLIGREMLVQTMPVIEEPLPVFEFSEVAEVDSTLPLGADSYRLEYQRLTGEAQVMRSGGTAPLVDASRDRVDRPHHILWSRSTVDFRERANGEFAGLASFSKKGAAALCRAYEQRIRRNGHGAFHNAPSIWKAQFTDMMQELIDRKEKVSAVDILSGWVDINSFADYQRAWQAIKA
jgi:hypothetical protein